MANESVIMRLDRVTRVFPTEEGRDNVVLKDVGLEVHKGEFVVLIGPSGCGKSTMLNIMAGFDRPTAGRITLNGRQITGPGPDKAMVFQDYALLPWLDAKGNVEIGLRLQGLGKGERRRVAVDFLKLVGLEAAIDRPVYKMSGGMQQRVSIARALALHPIVLLMDEPFGALDALQRGIMHVELTRIWRETQATIVFVTHSLDEAVFLADRVVAMTSVAAGISGELPVGLPRPRDPLSAAFQDCKRALLGMLQLGDDDEAAKAVAS